MYKVLIEKKIEKEIKRLGTTDQERVYKALISLEKNPRPKGKRIKPFHGIEHGYRLRVGSVRVLYVVDDENQEVKIVRADYRGDIY